MFFSINLSESKDQLYSKLLLPRHREWRYGFSFLLFYDDSDVEILSYKLFYWLKKLLKVNPNFFPTFNFTLNP
jgi:hypothetical protein